VNPLQRIVDVIICYLVRPIAHRRGTERYVFSSGQKMISGEVRQTFLPVSFDHYVIIGIMTWLCLLNEKMKFCTHMWATVYHIYLIVGS